MLESSLSISWLLSFSLFILIAWHHLSIISYHVSQSSYFEEGSYINKFTYLFRCKIKWKKLVFLKSHNFNNIEASPFNIRHITKMYELNCRLLKSKPFQSLFFWSANAHQGWTNISSGRCVLHLFVDTTLIKISVCI